ncbi:ABC transporter substrate-binding protein [Egicoccus sp. AB-alg2]|uniref:ABC transporter substrate-binding protein n=1 Tax=Egicoccus sp. AB-alg2 TaxID=3242693 RepID=UPI00359D0A51
MPPLPLTFACGDYDRTRALEEGTVRASGISLNYLRLPVEETFFRMMRHQEFDVAEMSFSSYVVSLQRDDPPFVALPVYTSRMFRHGGIFVRSDAGIEQPEDLVGKTVGSPEFQLSACVWIRGILAEHHGLPVDSVRYRTGGQEKPGRIEKAALDLPPEIEVEPIAPGQTLSRMLVEGEIDAIYSPRIPSPFTEGDPRVRRLFPDVIAAETKYFGKTGIFPIMHVVAIRREVYETNRWIAQSLMKAFSEAKERAYRRFDDSSALPFTLPWMTLQFEEARRRLGDDFWSYGLQDNWDDLDAFLRYHHEQGLSKRRVTPEELFAPEALESFVI